jgi:preprotein translocase subunit SecE
MLKKLVQFLKEVKIELKKVTWPNRQEVIGTTIVVIVAVFIFGIFLFLVDQGLNFIITKIFDAFSA